MSVDDIVNHIEIECMRAEVVAELRGHLTRINRVGPIAALLLERWLRATWEFDELYVDLGGEG